MLGGTLGPREDILVKMCSDVASGAPEMSY